ncbi:MAG: hypothetical protein WCE30_16370, partial [Mycobacterium sp.]
MTFNNFAKSAAASTTALAVSLFGAGVAFASPETDTHSGSDTESVSNNNSGGNTARNNNNNLNWGDDWSLGGFPPINLSSMPAPEADLSVPLSVGLPGLGLPSIWPSVNVNLGGILSGIGAAAATSTVTGLSSVANA